MGHAASQTCPGEARHACEPQARQRSGQGSVVQTGMARARAFSDRTFAKSSDCQVKASQVREAEYSRGILEIAKKIRHAPPHHQPFSEKVTEASRL